MADALSRKTQHSLNTIVITHMSLLKEFDSMGIQLVLHGQASVQLSALTLQPSIVEKEVTSHT